MKENFVYFLISAPHTIRKRFQLISFASACLRKLAGLAPPAPVAAEGCSMPPELGKLYDDDIPPPGDKTGVNCAAGEPIKEEEVKGCPGNIMELFSMPYGELVLPPLLS
jgi:hypothetical protein